MGAHRGSPPAGPGRFRRHPVFAWFYGKASPALERAGMADIRRTWLAGLTGEVIEVGAGSGASFEHYPPEVTRVVAIEPDPHLRQLALARAEQANVAIEVIPGVAERLDVDDAAFDAAVVMLVLCSVDEPGAAVAELHRVVRPGGELRFVEHVRGRSTWESRIQRILDATVWPTLGGGCHTHRDSVSTIEDGGFKLQRLDRFRFPDGPVWMPTSPHAAGTAERPSSRGDEG